MVKDWSDKTILIAEDERINFMFLERLLAPGGAWSGAPWAPQRDAGTEFLPAGGEDPTEGKS